VGYFAVSCLTSDPSTASLCNWTASLKMTRKFGARRLTGAVFFSVAKAFDTGWIDALF
jgi:hypothetical protein